MANIPNSPTWSPDVYQIAPTDAVLGGPDGAINVQAKQLADRTAYLKQEVEAAGAVADGAETKADSALTQIADIEAAAGSAQANAADALLHKQGAQAAQALTEQARNAAQAAQAQAGDDASYSRQAAQLAQLKASEAQSGATAAVFAAGTAQEHKNAALAAQGNAEAAMGLAEMARDDAIVARQEAQAIAAAIDPDTATDATAPLAGTERLPIKQSGLFKRLGLSALADWVLKIYAGYMPSGTGAVARTVQSKLRETVSVFDFMTADQIAAIRDGASTDDTAAIQAAMNAANTMKAGVYFPLGTYLIGSGITVPASVTGIFSHGATIKRSNPNAFWLLLLQSADIEVSGLTVDGNYAAFPSANATQYIDILTTSNRAVISSCVFKNAVGSSIGGQANGIRVIGCSFNEWKDHAIYFSGTNAASNATNISIVNNNFKHGSGADNGCIKFRNNVTNAVVDSNIISLESSVPFIQNDQGGVVGLGDGVNYFNKRIVISNNSGSCIYFYGSITATPIVDISTAKSLTSLVGNNVSCSFFAYLGSPSAVSIGDLAIKNNVVQGTLLWFRNISNSGYSNTFDVIGNTVIGEFAVCVSVMPSRFIVESNVISVQTFFLSSDATDTDASAKVVEIKNNYIVKTGAAAATLIPHYRLQENTAVYVIGNYIENVSYITNSMGNGPLKLTIDSNVSSGGAVTASNSQEFTSAAGSLVISNNTFRGRLMLENANTKSSCMLTRYNSYIFGNRADNVSEVVYTFGIPVTSYAGSNRFYSQGNFGLGSTVSNGYPAGVKSGLPAITL